MKIGFIGCGKMAEKMASVLKNLKDYELYACAARDLDRANDFKDCYGFKVAYGNYEELVKDKKVDIVYISTVTKTHYEIMMLCIKNHKRIVCEKPFTVNSIESKEVIEEARENNVFLAEAIWTRYMPIKEDVIKDLDSGVIGTPYLYLANIGYKIFDIERMQDPIGGGVLLDCGVYPINFVRMYARKTMNDFEAFATLTKSGVDDFDVVKFELDSSTHALITNTMRSNIDLTAYIYGTNGYIKFDNVNNPKRVEVYSNDRPPKFIMALEANKKLTGYEYQWLEISECIKKDMIETQSMPLNETQYIMELLDSIRAKAGIKFHNDK